MKEGWFVRSCFLKVPTENFTCSYKLVLLKFLIGKWKGREEGGGEGTWRKGIHGMVFLCAITGEREGWDLGF